jgi:hypothetical protein
VEVLDLQAAGGQRRRAHPQAAGDHRRARVERDSVAVDRDADLVQTVLRLAAVELRLAEIDEHEVHVGAAGEHGHPVAGLPELLGQRPGAVQRAPLALAERLALGDLQRHRLAGDDMLERAALLAREHRRVDLLRQLLDAEDHPAARAAQRLVDRRRHHVGVRDGVRVQAGGHQPGEVRHVDDEQGADLVGDLPEAGEVELARVGRPAGQDDLRAALAGDARHLVHVDPIGLGRDLVGGDVVQPARHVELHAVGQVAAVGQREPHDRLAGLQQRVVDRRVGLGAGVRLHVGVLGPEQRLGPIDGQLLDDVDVLAPAVVAAARVALRVLVGQHAALALEHRHRHEVLRRDHLERALLALQLAADGVGHLGIDVGKRAVEEIGHGRATVAASGGRSRAAIWPTRRAWRPPSNSVRRNAPTIASASCGPSRAPLSVTTLASLWRRAISASEASWALTARTPATLLATIATPTPDPQASTPRSASPPATIRAASAANCG